MFHLFLVKRPDLHHLFSKNRKDVLFLAHCYGGPEASRRWIDGRGDKNQPKVAWELQYHEKEKLFPGVGARAFFKIRRLDDTLAASPGLEDSPQKVHNLPLGASLSLIY